MLTAYQCSTVAYATEYGELLCPDCAEKVRGDGATIPIIEYALGEEQVARSEDSESWGDNDYVNHEECLHAIYCEDCGGELAEEYHYGHEES